MTRSARRTRGARRTAGAVLGLVALGAAGVGVGPASPAVADDNETQPCKPGQTHYIPTDPYNLTALGFRRSWGMATGKGVTVAVVDSGVDARNAHLVGGVVRSGTTFVGGDPTGRADVDGHGTMMAGIIAARPRPDLKSGLIGAAPGATILPVRVFEHSPSEDTSQPVAFPPDNFRMARGIRWAADHGAEVINVSMSSAPGTAGLKQVSAAVAHARSKDALVVAAAGNPGPKQQPPVTEPRYPAADPGVLGVAATNAAGAVDDFSVHGSQVDVAAPGSNVLVTFFDNGDCLAGAQQPFTSYSTAYVSGLAALLRQRFPQESADQIAYRITASADRPREGRRDDDEGWGTIQPYAALTMTLDPHRPGPPLPGHATAPQQPQPKASVRPLAARSNPLTPARTAALWWALVTVGLAAVALMMRPLLNRRQRAADRASGRAA